MYSLRRLIVVVKVVSVFALKKRASRPGEIVKRAGQERIDQFFWRYKRREIGARFQLEE